MTATETKKEQVRKFKEAFLDAAKRNLEILEKNIKWDGSDNDYLQIININNEEARAKPCVTFSSAFKYMDTNYYLNTTLSKDRYVNDLETI